MKLLSANVRGLNKAYKQREIRNIVVKNKIELVVILETRVRANNFSRVMKSCFSGWEVINNYAYAENGRMWVAWRSNWRMDVLEASDQFIHCRVERKGEAMLVTAIYASNGEKKRATLWGKLRQMGGGQVPWLMVGDYNEIISIEEKISGRRSDKYEQAGLKEMMDVMGLRDLRSVGCYYTWTNGQEGVDQVFSKIDRAIANLHWFCKYDVAAEFQSMAIFDHCLVMINTEVEVRDGKRPFKFQNMWTMHKE